MAGTSIGLFRQLLARRTGRRSERLILDLLAGAGTDALNEMLADPELTDRLFGAVRDHWFGPRHHRELVDLLCRARRDELNLAARAAVIHALQTGHTGRRAERLVRDLFCEVRGEQLTMLKNLIDASPDHNDLEELVYADIDSRSIRAEILAHIAAEAATVSEPEAKVLSDIDDTVICSLHDRRFPKGITYPGVLALWEALDQGPHANPRTLGDLAFLTARPADLLGWVEDRTRRRLRASGVGKSSMLTGSVLHLLTHGGMANKKIKNVRHYHQLYPEYRLVFIGDSGQGDVLVGRHLRDEFAGTVDAVLIHDVINTDEATRAEYGSQGIVLFDTYVGAANVVHQLGLINDAGLAAVVAACRTGFDDIEWNSAAQEVAARALLARDLTAAGF